MSCTSARGELASAANFKHQLSLMDNLITLVSNSIT